MSGIVASWRMLAAIRRTGAVSGSESSVPLKRSAKDTAQRGMPVMMREMARSFSSTERVTSTSNRFPA